jgi:hypothetical protein
MHRLKPLKDKMNFKENSNIEWLNPLTTKEMSQLSHKESIVGDFMNLVIETESLAFREGQNRSAPSGFHPEKRVLEYACVYMENGADQGFKKLAGRWLETSPLFFFQQRAGWKVESPAARWLEPVQHPLAVSSKRWLEKILSAV